MKLAFVLILIAILVGAPHISGQGNDVMKYPFLVHADLPSYPPLAKIARISGTVQVRVTVENGEVVGYVQPSGNPLLVSATIDNIKSWKFDKSVRTTFATTFIFQLDGKSGDQRAVKSQARFGITIIGQNHRKTPLYANPLLMTV